MDSKLTLGILWRYKTFREVNCFSGCENIGTYDILKAVSLLVNMRMSGIRIV